MALEYEETQMILKGFAEIRKSLDAIATTQVQDHQVMQAIRNEMASAKAVHTLMDNVDGLAKQFTDHQEDHDLADSQAQRLQRQIEYIAQRAGISTSDLPV